MKGYFIEETGFTGHGRVGDALLAAVVFSLLGVLVSYLVSTMCFHNIAGVEVAAPNSERGPWCEAIAPGPAWELRLIGAALAFGGLVTLLPLPGRLRVGLLALGGAALTSLPAYMGTLEYSVTI